MDRDGMISRPSQAALLYWYRAETWRSTNIIRGPNSGLPPPFLFISTCGADDQRTPIESKTTSEQILQQYSLSPFKRSCSWPPPSSHPATQIVQTNLLHTRFMHLSSESPFRQLQP